MAINTLALTDLVVKSSPVKFDHIEIFGDLREYGDSDDLYFEYSEQDEKNNNSYGHYLAISFDDGAWGISHNDANNCGGHPTRETFSSPDINIALEWTLKYIKNNFN